MGVLRKCIGTCPSFCFATKLLSLKDCYHLSGMSAVTSLGLSFIPALWLLYRFAGEASFCLLPV